MGYLQDKLQDAAALPADRPMGMPGAFYTSQEQFEHEARTVLRSGWHCLGREDEIPEMGVFSPHNSSMSRCWWCAERKASCGLWQMAAVTAACRLQPAEGTPSVLCAAITRGLMAMTGHYCVLRACRTQALMPKAASCLNTRFSFGTGLFM